MDIETVVFAEVGDADVYDQWERFRKAQELLGLYLVCGTGRQYEIWVNRHAFHRLRPSVETDQQKLEQMAQANLRLLDELKDEFFGYDIRGQRVIPNHPEYWSLKEGKPLI